MTVQRIYESPRVTKPYSEEQWQQIEALGHQVDVDLQVGDVRLTMGGEPTFISLDDRNGSEWSTTAMSPAKRKLAVELLLQNARPFFPRAHCSISGRANGIPAKSCLAGRWAVTGAKMAFRSGKIKASSPKTAKITATAHPKPRKFLEALTRRLQVSSDFTITAYEDIFFHLWKERRLPEIIDPARSQAP